MDTGEKHAESRRKMDFDKRIRAKLVELGDDDKRLIAELAEFLAARREGLRVPSDWDCLALAALMAEGDHPDEIDYQDSDLVERA
jgi:hypothetical protein